jgi:hypothetical protein
MLFPTFTLEVSYILIIVWKFWNSTSTYYYAIDLKVEKIQCFILATYFIDCELCLNSNESTWTYLACDY